MEVQARKKSSIEFFELLPDCIIDHIISFLPGKERLNLSIMSRRFRQLCKSSTSFLFIGDSRNNKTLEELDSYLSEFLTELFRRRKEKKIYRFDLRYSKCCSSSSSSSSSTDNENNEKDDIVNAARVTCLVDEDLYLDINLLVPKSKLHFLPQFVSASSVLCDLNLRLMTKYLQLLWIPWYGKYPSIQVLSLSCLQIRCPNPYHWINENLKSLRKLSLTSVDVEETSMKNLHIHSKSIEDLSINHCFPQLECIAILCPKLHTLSITHFHENEERGRRRSTADLHIFAAKLDNITLNGNRFGPWYGSFENFEALHYASIDIKDSPCDNVAEFLWKVRGATVLQLDIDVIQDLFKSGRTIIFKNAHDLVVKVDHLNDTQMLAILSFLEGLRNLCNLTLSSKSSEKSSTHNLRLNGPVGLDFLKSYARDFV